MDTSFHCLSFFQDFLSNQTHITKISFWFWEKQGSTIDSVYGLLLLSRAPHDSIGTTVLSRVFLLCNIRTAKISYSKKDIFQSVPPNKTFTFLAPHNNYSHPHKKFYLLWVRLPINASGRRNNGLSSLFFTFKNVLFFIYCTEQNTNKIIWLRCYLLTKTRRSIPKWYGSTIFLKQLSSSNNK